ncbi:hypothetical protein HBA55_03115 [Pseudomaricurvus alkylphenolicus]|uniref:AraC family ligand binding domain-containing protein n=1 Tax=Pseudomaricurvus alkylphenolicus TaxID=1306991 RepID=UPI0014241022|nr:hypothetical protein [Pseudomaricurvus alkylphenolicus]
MKIFNRMGLYQAAAVFGLVAGLSGCVTMAGNELTGAVQQNTADRTQLFSGSDRDFQQKSYSVSGTTLEGDKQTWKFRYREQPLAEISGEMSAEAGAPPIAVGFRELDGSSQYDAWPLPYDEIIQGVKGHLQVRVGNETYDCLPGDILWIPKGTVVEYRAVGGLAQVFYTIPHPNSLQPKSGSDWEWQTGDAVAPVSKPRLVKNSQRQYINVPAQLRTFSDGSTRVQKTNFYVGRGIDVEHTQDMTGPAAAFALFPEGALHGWMEIPYNEVIFVKQGHFKALVSQQRFKDHPTDVQVFDAYAGDVLWLPKGTYVNYETVGEAELYFLMNPGCCFDMAVPGEWEPEVWESRLTSQD